MRKISVCLSILLVFAFNAGAQITITTSHMPKSGDTIRYSTAAINNAPDVSKTGTNYSWDFSDLEPSSQDIFAYKASGQTPYILNFGFSAIGLKIADSLGTGQIALQNLYEFYKNSSAGWEGVGLGFSYSSFPLPQAGKNSDPDEIYVFPLNYDDTSKTTYSVKVPIMLSIVPVGNFFREGKRTTVVDGWGKISTPYAQNVDCIRVKSTIEGKDSIAITTPALNFGFPSTRVEYKWLSTTERIPMLEVSGAVVGGNFVANTIRYRDSYRNITGPLTPTADFEANVTNPGAGDTVRITDKSTGLVQNRTWSITPTSGYSYVSGTNANAANPVLVFQTPGNYSVSLKVSNLAGENTMSKNNYIQVKSTGSVSNPIKNTAFWPNPTDGWLNIDPSIQACKVYNTAGVCVLSAENVTRLDMRSFPSGVYLLSLTSQSNHQIAKIIKY